MPKRKSYIIIAALVTVLQIFTITMAAQDLDLKIAADEAAQTVRVEGKLRGEPIKNIHFRTPNAGSKDRIEGITLFLNGKAVGVKRLMENEFLADAAFNEFAYTVDLSTVSGRSAHKSWIDDRAGMLYLDDIIFELSGESGDGLNLRATPPAGWHMFSGKPGKLSRSVLILGKDLQSKEFGCAGTGSLVVLEGKRQFSVEDVSAMAGGICKYYSDVFGEMPTESSLIAILSNLSPLPNGTWEAETKGDTITIVSADLPFRTRSLQLLHEQLRHEIFHLWIPNGVWLKGDYSFFYEGFALYASLKMAARTGQIRFEDFLDTLSRAYEIDRVSKPGSFLPPAKRTVTEKYARGILTGFVIDVSLMAGSKGRNDIESVLRKIYEAHCYPAGESDGNEVFLRAIALPELTEKLIVRGEGFDWAKSLDEAGLTAPPSSPLKLSVVERPKGRQETLLDKLGYNGWRNNGKRT